MCYSFAEIDKDAPATPTNPCVPSPCGPFATCRDSGYAGVPICTCLENYVGSAPNCRPECTVDSECSNDRACLRQKCRDPCPGSCGIGAQCLVVNHMAVCLCSEGYTGDPFANCFPEPPRKRLILSLTFILYDAYKPPRQRQIAILTRRRDNFFGYASQNHVYLCYLIMYNRESRNEFIRLFN